MKTGKKFFSRIDLTEGRPWKVILLFSIPIFFTLILNNAFSLINALVLKTTVGGDSVTAVNSTSSISNILFQFAYGIGGGFTIVISEQIGKKDYKNLKKTFYNAIYLSIVIGIIIGIIGLIFYKDLLVLLNIDERYFNKAQQYYKIILISFVFMLLNNYFSNALRAMGDSFAPLIISLIGAVFNISFAFLFTGVLDLDTKGVAFATMSANLISSLLAFIYMIKKYEFLRGRIEKFDKNNSLKMLKLGIPLGIQWSILFIGSFFQDQTINEFGNGLATKAVSCYSPFVTYLTIPISTITSAMLNYIGQNYGKSDLVRIKKGIKDAIIIDLVIYLVIIIVGFSLLNYVPYIFLPAKEVDNIVEGPIIKYYCYTYLKVLIPCLIMQALLTLCRSTLQGIQKTTITLLSGIGELFARIFICAVIPSLINASNPLSNESFIGVCFSTPMAWFVSLVIMGISVIYYLRKESKKLNN